MGALPTTYLATRYGPYWDDWEVPSILEECKLTPWTVWEAGKYVALADYIERKVAEGQELVSENRECSGLTF